MTVNNIDIADLIGTIPPAALGEEIERRSSGVPALDDALGGGLPHGRLVEVYGPESSGKTTLCLYAIAEAQRAGGVTAFIDAEHDFDPGYAETLGVDLSRLLIAQPDSGEHALETIEALIRPGVVDLVVVNSVAALVPQGDKGLQARVMSQAMRKLASLAAQTGTTLVFVNQLSQHIGVTFGHPENTGGYALKFYASVRLDVRRIGGALARAKVVKNKFAPPFCGADFDI
jgi:recombination protein RecA